MKLSSSRTMELRLGFRAAVSLIQASLFSLCVLVSRQTFLLLLLLLFVVFSNGVFFDDFFFSLESYCLTIDSTTLLVLSLDVFCLNWILVAFEFFRFWYVIQLFLNHLNSPYFVKPYLLLVWNEPCSNCRKGSSFSRWFAAKSPF